MNDELKKFIRGFGFAAHGFAVCVRTQRNMRFHLCAAGAVIFLSVICGLGRTENAILALTVSSVISAEAFNTAAEFTVDLCTSERHPLAEKAKDCAAGAVLVTAVSAVTVGIFIFGNEETFHRIISWFGADILRYAAAAAYAAFSVCFVFGAHGGKEDHKQ